MRRRGNLRLVQAAFAAGLLASTVASPRWRPYRLMVLAVGASAPTATGRGLPPGASPDGELSESRLEALECPGWSPEREMSWQRAYRLALAHAKAGTLPPGPASCSPRARYWGRGIRAQLAGWDRVIPAQPYLLQTLGVDPHDARGARPGPTFAGGTVKAQHRSTPIPHTRWPPDGAMQTHRHRGRRGRSGRDSRGGLRLGGVIDNTDAGPPSWVPSVALTSTTSTAPVAVLQSKAALLIAWSRSRAPPGRAVPDAVCVLDIQLGPREDEAGWPAAGLAVIE